MWFKALSREITFQFCGQIFLAMSFKWRWMWDMRGHSVVKYTAQNITHKQRTQRQKSYRFDDGGGLWEGECGKVLLRRTEWCTIVANWPKKTAIKKQINFGLVWSNVVRSIACESTKWRECFPAGRTEFDTTCCCLLLKCERQFKVNRRRNSSTGKDGRVPTSKLPTSLEVRRETHQR